jgi:polar amino acid transport system substrate-binding protein
MKLWHRIQAVVLAGILAATSLGLTGCFTPGREGALALPTPPSIAPPDIVSPEVLRVGFDSSHAPFAGLSGQNIIGIDVDIAAALAEQMGLKLEIVEIKDQDVNALLKGIDAEGNPIPDDARIDMVMSVQTDAAAPFAGIQVGPYLIDGTAVFAVGLSSDPKEFNPADLNGVKIVAKEGTLSAWRVTKDYGEESLITYPSLEKAFEELAAGTVSYAAADAIVGSFLAVQYENVRCEGMFSESEGVYVGFAPDKQKLAEQLTKELRDLRDSGKLQVIVAKWLGPVSAKTVLNTQAIVALNSAGEALTDAEQNASVTG